MITGSFKHSLFKHEIGLVEKTSEASDTGLKT